MELINIKLSDMVVPSYMKLPRAGKIETKKKIIQKYGKPTKPIRLSKDLVILDGYASYLAMQELGIEETMILKDLETQTYINTQTVYVFGKHLNNATDKEYVWRCRKTDSDDFLSSTNVGDKVFVYTRFGKTPIIITRIEILDKPPIDKRIKKVIGKASY